jgi:rare lipoprotein A
MKNRALFIVLSLTLLVAGCARRKKVRMPAPPVVGAVETGTASWYGRPYHGRRAASGEIYDMEKFTAAHRTLPFGTWVAVRNIGNGKTVRVRINDRGPFVDGRIIDISRAAARSIDMLGPGTARVRVEILSLPSALSINELFAVQVGAFKNRSNAERLRKTMASRFGSARLVVRQGDVPMWRVLVGRESSMEGANDLAEKLRAEHSAAFVVRLDDAGN